MLPDAPWQHGAGMNRLLAALDASGGETRYVGGCVRDALIGLAVSDVDLATRLEPQEVMSRLMRARIKAVPTGLAHGTVTAVVEGAPVEVTTLRRDVSTDGRHAEVAFTGDWQEDAARRDFTINALSADPLSRELFDYFGGLADLTAGRVAFIGDPLRRIAEDHLRILRFFRFHARFGRGEPDAPALAACAARANDLMALSRERIADELLKLLALPGPLSAVTLMVEHGILRPVLPEIGADGIERLNALIALEQALGVSPDALRRLAALLPADRTLAASVAARLRLSKKSAQRLTAAADRSERPPDDARMLAYAIGVESARDRLLLDGPDERRAAQLRSLDAWTRPRLPVTGGDLIAMGLEAGPAVSAALQALDKEWASAGFSQDREAVRQMARRRVDRLLRDGR
ncbi:MAG TPA: CCA tRNA nucleotidyltransferase [Allosphingosinicella sp.]|nr:CCA tRNA nucleotidyltransferase [Allosphingosinicella sp.]